jgi:NADPH-dependent curcumin reductase
LFETVLRHCIRERLVGGEGFAVDASLIKADANRQKGIDGNKWIPPEAAGYRETSDLAAAIRAACPDGNDILFDNTGGSIADAAIRTMRLHGRVIQCGTAANASWTPVPTGPRPEREILTRRLRWCGFIIFDHVAEFETAAARLAELALAGKIVHDEDILPGLEHAPGAIAQLYRGENHGKLMIEVD